MSSNPGQGLEGADWLVSLRFKILQPAAVPPLAAEHGGGALAPRVDLRKAVSKVLPILRVAEPLLRDLDHRTLGHPKTLRRE